MQLEVEIYISISYLATHRRVSRHNAQANAQAKNSIKKAQAKIQAKIIVLLASRYTTRIPRKLGRVSSHEWRVTRSGCPHKV